MNHNSRNRFLLIAAICGTLLASAILFSSIISRRDNEETISIDFRKSINNQKSFDDDKKCFRPTKLSTRLAKVIKQIESDSCVQTILNVACLLEKNILYPNSLQSQCDSSAAISKTKKQMASIAFLILVKQRQNRQLKRLLINIYRPEHTYFIYIDNCSNRTLAELKNELANFPNIYIKQHRSNSCGSSDDLHLTMTALNYFLIKNQNWNWDYILKLNDDDFPIVVIEDMSRFFAITFGTNYLEYRNYSLSKTKVAVQCHDHSHTVGYADPPIGIRIQTGPYNFAVTADFVKFWLSSTDSLIAGLLKWVKRMPKPEEIFLPTLITNSIFCRSIDNRSLFARKFKSTNSSIETNFDDKDLLNLLPDSNFLQARFFAQNVNPMINQQIIENLESVINSDSNSDSYSSMIGLKNYWFTLWNSSESKLADTENSFVKLSKLLITDRLKRCRMISHFSFVPLSLTILRRFDIYEGILLRFQMKCQEKMAVFEAFVQSVHQQTIFPTEVGMKMDKELLNLNVESMSDIETKKYSKIFGISDKLKLISDWVIGDENVECSAVCLNPAGRVQGLQKMNISKSDLTAETTLKITSNLEPGLLTVQLVKSMQLIGETKLFIFPNSDSNTEEDEVTNFKKFKKTFSDFYKIKRLCIAKNSKSNFASCQCSKPEIPICETTDWSSYSPDTKSDLSKLKHR